MHAPLLDKQRRLFFCYLIVIAITQASTLIWLIYQAKLALQSSTFNLSYSWFFVAIAGVSVIAVGRYLERYLAELFAQKYVDELRQSVFTKALNLPASDALLINKGGTLLRLTGDMSTIRNWIVNGLVPSIVFAIWLLIALISLGFINYFFIASLVPTIIFMIIGNYWLGQKLYLSSKNVRRTRGQLIRNVTEKLREFRLIKLFNQNTRENGRFADQSQSLASGNVDKAYWSGLLRGFNEGMLGLGILSLLSVGLYLVKHNLAMASDVIIVMSGALYFLSHIRPLSRLYELWTLKKLAEHKLIAFFQRESRISSGTKRKPNGAITFTLESVSLYPALQSIDAEIAPHDRILLTGKAGSGKSNLLLFLAGILQAKKGHLLINHIKLNRYQSWVNTQLVALVSPEIPLLRGSINRNLFYGARKQDASHTETILSICKIEQLISSKSAGMQHRIQEGGSNLSSTERYQIMLARALLRKPSLLLIDNDAALLNPEINEIIINILNWFEGAIVLVQPASPPPYAFDQTWELDKDIPMICTKQHHLAMKSSPYV